MDITMWIDKLAYKLRRFAIPSLMKYIVLAMGAVFVLDFVFLGRVTSLLAFSRAAIMSGQIWRILSFIFIPVDSSPLFILFALYFYWLIGEALEREWGAAKFNLFYLTGILGSIAAGWITGFATNHYLNLSLFFAFAILYPEFELLLFFVLPIKIKWLAVIDAVYFVYLLIVSGWPQRIALLVAIANILIFFEKDVRNRIHQYRRRQQWRNHFK